MAGARAQPIHFDTSGYLQANELIARAGEIRARGLLALGQGIASGVGMMVQKKEAAKDRDLRERMQAASLSQDESQFVRSLAQRQAEEAAQNSRGLAALMAERGNRDKEAGLQMFRSAASIMETDPEMAQSYFDLGRSFLESASGSYSNSEALVGGLMGGGAVRGRAPAAPAGVTGASQSASPPQGFP